MSFQYNAFLIRYHEIAIKGRNRRMFENKLIESIRRLLKTIDDIKVLNQRGRIVIHLGHWRKFTPEEASIAIEQLQKCFGVESYSPVICIDPDFDSVEKETTDIFEAAYADFEKKLDQDPTRKDSKITYRMRARRSFKKFPMKSKEMEIHFANIFLRKHDRLKVDLEHAEFSIGLEVRRLNAFVWFESYKGPGGLPVGSSGSLLCLLSGGIDSPVACYTAMKRGSQCTFLTFHSHPYTPPTTISKVADLTKVINGYQKPMPLYACNLGFAQKAIRDNCHERFRTILYRRMMMRVATVVADWNNDLALLTGEALGQVASQTLSNMSVINRSTSKLILRPLVGFDKNEAIILARKMKTMELSEIDVPDSCTVFAPDSPATSSKLHIIEAEEAKLDLAALVRQCIAETEYVNPETYDRGEPRGLRDFIASYSDEDILNI
jgi:thiamine biosynthesis protein ThiI